VFRGSSIVELDLVVSRLRPRSPEYVVELNVELPCQCYFDGGGELMNSTRSDKLRFRTSFGVHLLWGAALCSGCRSDGAGTIHVDSPKAKKLMMLTGSAVAPTATAKPGPSGKTQKSVPRAAIRTPGRTND
jgi:hypothetical protein